MSLCRLIYKSATSWDLLSNKILSDLGKSSERNNRKREISGLLLLSGETFLQVLEGPPKVVNKLYGKILLDKRHHTPTLISYEQTVRRYFDNWSMRILDLSDLPLNQREIFQQKYEEEEGFPKVPDDYERAFSLLWDAKAFCLAESVDS